MNPERQALKKNTPGYFLKVFTYPLCISIYSWVFIKLEENVRGHKLRFDPGHGHVFTAERKAGYAYYVTRTQTDNFKINNTFVLSVSYRI